MRKETWAISFKGTFFKNVTKIIKFINECLFLNKSNYSLNISNNLINYKYISLATLMRKGCCLGKENMIFMMFAVFLVITYLFKADFKIFFFELLKAIIKNIASSKLEKVKIYVCLLISRYFRCLKKIRDLILILFIFYFLSKPKDPVFGTPFWRGHFDDCRGMWPFNFQHICKLKLLQVFDLD